MVACWAASSARALARGDADAHHGRAGILHDRADVREVEVDEAGDGDEVGDALDTLAKRVVADAEGVDHADVFLSTISSRRSLGMTMRVSTFWESRSIPWSA